MTAMVVLSQALSEGVDLLTLVSPDPAPEDDDVKAGWVAFLVFGALAGAVVLLGFSLVKQLRKAEQAKEAGVYGDEPEPPGGTDVAEADGPDRT